MTPAINAKLAALAALEAAHRELLEQTSESAEKINKLNATIIGEVSATLEIKPGETYLITSADRVAPAKCLYVEPLILPDCTLGLNAVFLLEGSKSVVCRIDHKSLVSQDGNEITTTATFSRDSTSAAYFASRNLPETPD